MAAVAKVGLKAAKSALDSQNYTEAINQARTVLEADPKNYFGSVFLGRAQEKQGNLEDAAKAYEAATKIKPDDELAWKGLCAVCETQGPKAIPRYIPAALGLAQVYAEKSDHHQCQTTIDKLVDFVRANGTRSEFKDALKLLLPSSPIYDFLEGRLQAPVLTYTRLAEITEAEESERINKEVGERRTRLGAKISQVKAEVTREIFGKSELETLYKNIIDWSSDDDVRREYEEKLVRRVYEHLLALSPENKKEKRLEVTKLAHEMVIIKHPYRLAWDLELEWKDFENIDDLDKGILREFVLFFPDSGVAKIIQAYNGQAVKPKAPKQVGSEEEKEEEKKKPKDEFTEDITPLSTEERLLMLSEGTDDAKDSPFAHRLTAEYYLQIEEYESSADASRKALNLIASEAHKSGLCFEENNDAVKTCLGTSLVYYLSPKNHPEAQTLFNDVLSRKPNSTAALLGVGLVYEEQELYSEAASFLERASQRDPDNVRIGAEASWCRAQMGQLETGLQQLQDFFEKIATTKNASLELKALISYRVGKLLWAIRKDKTSRKDRKGAYAYFIAAIKANPFLAPPYTGLGLYYADYAKDKRRARQCFQKAFELSSTEVKAAERLARSFADDSEWDIVEIITQRVVDSGVVKPAPGSKKRGISWPFAAMGVVQMNKQDYSKAVVSFQAALRIAPQDYNSWVGLGESYHSSGRYNAGRRALDYAISIRQSTDDNKYDDAWFADYMLANVHRELGEYDDALSGYRTVLDKRPHEFGVSIALLQTLIERAQHSLETGFFGDAIDGAKQAIVAAGKMDRSYYNAFNFWKAVGDACMIFSRVPNRKEELPVSSLLPLMDSESVANDDFVAFINKSLPDRFFDEVTLLSCLYAGMRSHRNSIAVSQQDFHALAVGWYNLGWTQYWTSHTEALSNSKSSTKFSKLAVRSFKRAIELEAGNADFWNALGIVTTNLNPKIAQHSFVRSLHLNERSARTWTDLGTLYLLQNDHELAHQAFARAQSTDPEYPFAWLGEGLIALLVGDMKEAISHFTHGVDIADSSVTAVKSHYLSAAFDHILSTSGEAAALVGPIFAAQQLQSLALSITPYRHLLALLQERVGDYSAAVDLLQAACDSAEATYEANESPEALAQYIRAKCDLARNQLAIRAFEAAAENAETTLDLSADDDAASMGLSIVDRTKCRLSAHMTAGLAHYHLQATDAAIAMFRSALEESDSAPNIVCLLAQMLWASGETQQRAIAKDQLFAAIETHAGHVGATTLLGAVALLEDDADTSAAMAENLQALRTDAALSAPQRQKIERLLADTAELDTTDDNIVNVVSAEVFRSIMLRPASLVGWSTLAQASGDAYAAEMAAKTAQGSVPPRGSLGAEDLAKTFAGTGGAGDTQRAIMAAPWIRDGWASLAECVS
ncbi:hypothetical protein FH972_026189 [Carpinus fangiana]|uniref:Uncharacterized protein n=1 Tax=Carpinus fangiana TaxID=176857 RepID=A0A5N6L3A9_9ROSI|nr:hypothetical protein FH972_026189 [Carpinus fangiana]